MKLTLLSAALFAMMVMTSCSGKSKTATETAADSDMIVYEEVEVVDVAADSVSGAASTAAAAGNSIIEKIKNAASESEINSYVQQAKDYVNQLVASGKLEQAKAYIAKVGPVIKEKAPKAYEAFVALVGEKGVSAVNEVKDAASKASDKAKNAAADAASKASDKASALKDALGE